MTASKGKRRAGIYVRISDDRGGEEKGVGRQEKDCRRVVKHEDWQAVEVYTENDTSAFTRRKVKLPDGSTAMRVVRPEFRRMLEDLANGAIDAIVVYDIDRMCRDPRDLEDLIDVIESTKAQTRAVTGELDLMTSQGRAVARVMVAFAQKSSEDTRRRVQRKHEELAEEGKLSGGGRRPFGFKNDRITHDPAEAAVVKELFRLAAKGESISSLARRLTAQGVPTVGGGKVWNARSVHSILTSPRVAGYRTFRGEIVKRAQWKAIVSKPLWDKVQIRLAATQRGEGHSSKLRYFLTGTLWCSKCGSQLTVNGGTPRVYWCSPRREAPNWKGGPRVVGCGKITVTGPRIEEYVERVLLTYLERPDVLQSLQQATSGKAVAHARAEAAQDQKQLLELTTMWSSKQISTKEYLHARKEIQDRIDVWDTLQQAALPAAVRRIASGDAAAIWEKLAESPTDRRDIVRAIWPNGILILPLIGARHTFNSERVVFLDWAGLHPGGRPDLTFPVDRARLLEGSEMRCLPTEEAKPDGRSRAARSGEAEPEPGDGPVLATGDRDGSTGGRAARPRRTATVAGSGQEAAAAPGRATARKAVKRTTGRAS
jgi:site-specific DNA recombinase